MGRGIVCRKKKMKLFIEEMDHSIWKDVKECPSVPTYEVNDVVTKKSEKDQSKDDKENVHHILKAKTVITIALGLDDFL